jgi:hypothetical protein
MHARQPRVTNTFISSPESIFYFFLSFVPLFLFLLHVAFVLRSLAAYIWICAAPAGSLMMMMIRMPRLYTRLLSVLGFFFLLKFPSSIFSSPF